MPITRKRHISPDLASYKIHEGNLKNSSDLNGGSDKGSQVQF